MLLTGIQSFKNPKVSAIVLPVAETLEPVPDLINSHLLLNFGTKMYLPSLSDLTV